MWVERGCTTRRRALRSATTTRNVRRPGDTSEVAPQDTQSTASHDAGGSQGHTPLPGGGKPQKPWRPPPRKTQASHNRQMFTAVAIALLVSFGALWIFARIASNHAGSINLGSRVFALGNAEKRAKQAKVSPLFFNDLVRDGRRLPVVLAFIGDPEWAALNAIPPGSTEACVVKWDEATRALIDPCTKTLYGPNGVRDGGPPLTRYLATVDQQGRLVVDLNTSVDNRTAATP